MTSPTHDDYGIWNFDWLLEGEDGLYGLGEANTQGKDGGGTNEGSSSTNGANSNNNFPSSGLNSLDVPGPGSASGSSGVNVIERNLVVDGLGGGPSGWQSDLSSSAGNLIGNAVLDFQSISQSASDLWFNRSAVLHVQDEAGSTLQSSAPTSALNTISMSDVNNRPSNISSSVSNIINAVSSSLIDSSSTEISKAKSKDKGKGKASAPRDIKGKRKRTAMDDPNPNVPEQETANTRDLENSNSLPFGNNGNLYNSVLASSLHGVNLLGGIPTNISQPQPGGMDIAPHQSASDLQPSVSALLLRAEALQLQALLLNTFQQQQHQQPQFPTQSQSQPPLNAVDHNQNSQMMALAGLTSLSGTLAMPSLNVNTVANQPSSNTSLPTNNALNINLPHHYRSQQQEISTTTQVSALSDSAQLYQRLASGFPLPGQMSLHHDVKDEKKQNDFVKKCIEDEKFEGLNDEELDKKKRNTGNIYSFT
jgi:hypothetical protein